MILSTEDLSCGLLCCDTLVLFMVTRVLENSGCHLQDYMASNPRRPQLYKGL